MITDGFRAWRTIENVWHLGCMAYARRPFDEAFRTQKRSNVCARLPLEYFKSLYQVETLARGTLLDGQRRADYTYELRQKRSVPPLDALKKWLDEEAP